MQKLRLTAALGSVALLLVAAGCDSRSSSGSGGYSTYGGGVPSRYATETHAESDDDSAEEARQAKSEFEDAAGELRSAVNALSFMPWRDQMPTIRSRLDDAEEALERLESLRPSDPAVQNARDEIDQMRSHMDRLHFENWRTVRPDLGTTSSAIEDEATAVADPDDE